MYSRFSPGRLPESPTAANDLDVCLPVVEAFKNWEQVCPPLNQSLPRSISRLADRVPRILRSSDGTRLFQPDVNNPSFVGATSYRFPANLGGSASSVNQRFGVWARCRKCQKPRPGLGHLGRAQDPASSRQATNSLKADNVVRLSQSLAKQRAGPTARPSASPGNWPRAAASRNGKRG